MVFKTLGTSQQRTVVLREGTEMGGAPQLLQLAPVRDTEGETRAELGKFPHCGYEYRGPRAG